MTTIKREDIKDELYQDIFQKEAHHDHEIIIDKHGIYRWKKDPVIDFLSKDLNSVVRQLHEEGHDKNSELYRKIYRSIGYSLNGYWEIFYWEANNEAADEYRSNERTK